MCLKLSEKNLKKKQTETLKLVNYQFDKNTLIAQNKMLNNINSQHCRLSETTTEQKSE